MTNKGITRVISGALLFAFVLCGPLFGQNFRGQVRGVISDQTGAVVPGATVTLSNTKTGVNATKRSDTAGFYIFDFVEPGVYTVAVQVTGFGKFNQENVVVQSGGDVTVNAALTPGTLGQSVMISEAPPAVEFNSSNQELTIRTEQSRGGTGSVKRLASSARGIQAGGETVPRTGWHTRELCGGITAARAMDRRPGRIASGVFERSGRREN
jgi:Carboxypeptidase regulatory-like domain